MVSTANTMVCWLRRWSVTDAALERSYALYLTRTRADWLALVVAVAVVTKKVPYLTLFIPYDVAMWLSLAIVVMPALAIILGVTRARGDFVRVLQGRSSWSIAILCGLAAGVLSYAGTFVFIYATRAGVLPLEDSGGGTLLFLNYVVFIPIMEEFCFQVVLQTRLTRFGPIASMLLTTIVFSLFHLEEFSRFPPGELTEQIHLFFALLVYAILRRCNGSFVGLVVAHGSSNGLAILCHSFLSNRTLH